MMYFPGCPECKRKCTQEGDQYKCEHCNKFLNPNEIKLTYTVTAKFDDMSDGIFVTFLSENADAIMGMSAVEFSKIKENQSNSIDYIRDILNERAFQFYNVVVKANVDNFNNNSDEMRLKYTAARSQLLDLKDENQMLLRRLKLYK